MMTRKPITGPESKSSQQGEFEDFSSNPMARRTYTAGQSANSMNTATMQQFFAKFNNGKNFVNQQMQPRVQTADGKGNNPGRTENSFTRKLRENKHAYR